MEFGVQDLSFVDLSNLSPEEHHKIHKILHGPKEGSERSVEFPWDGADEVSGDHELEEAEFSGSASIAYADVGTFIQLPAQYPLPVPPIPHYMAIPPGLVYPPPGIPIAFRQNAPSHVVDNQYLHDQNDFAFRTVVDTDQPMAEVLAQNVASKEKLGGDRNKTMVKTYERRNKKKRPADYYQRQIANGAAPELPLENPDPYYIQASVISSRQDIFPPGVQFPTSPPQALQPAMLHPSAMPPTVMHPVPVSQDARFYNVPLPGGYQPYRTEVMAPPPFVEPVPRYKQDFNYASRQMEPVPVAQECYSASSNISSNWSDVMNADVLVQSTSPDSEVVISKKIATVSISDNFPHDDDHDRTKSDQRHPKGDNHLHRTSIAMSNDVEAKPNEKAHMEPSKIESDIGMYSNDSRDTHVEPSVIESVNETNTNAIDISSGQPSNVVRSGDVTLTATLGDSTPASKVFQDAAVASHSTADAAVASHSTAATSAVPAISRTDSTAATSAVPAKSRTESTAATRTDSTAATRTDSTAATRTDSTAATRTDSTAATRTDSTAATRTDSTAATRTDSTAATRTDSTVAPAPPKTSWAGLFKSTTSTQQAIIYASGTNNSDVTSSKQVEAAAKAENFYPTVIPATEDDVAKRLGDILKNMSLTFKPASLQPRGLINRGNWCYINATLQALLSCSPFFNLLKSFKPYPALTRGPSSTPIMDSLVQFVHEFSPLIIPPQDKNDKRKLPVLNSGVSFEPDNVYKMLQAIEVNPTFKLGKQEDAEEFLSCVLNGLHDEMAASIKLVTETKELHEEAEKGRDVNGFLHVEGENSVPSTEEDQEWEQVGPKKKSVLTRRTDFANTPISKIFAGYTRSAIYKSTAKESDTLQPFFTLQLDIQSEKVWTVRDALEGLASRESVSGYTCDRTNAPVEVVRRMTLEELPLILILHFKCFIYDKSGGSQKLIKKVDYPVDLEINKDLLSPNVKSKLPLLQRSYKLFAVVFHHGKAATGGHYTVDIFHPGLKAWLHYDDSVIKIVPLVQVLRYSLNRVPYLLYYRRMDMS